MADSEQRSEQHPTAQATLRTHKLCRHCWARRPVGEFRYLDRGSGRLHPECRGCRRRNDVQKREAGRRRSFQDGMRRIRRAASTAQLANLVAGLADECGGIEAVVTRFLGLLDSASDLERLKGTRTLLTLACLVEQERIAERLAELQGADLGPVAQLQRLHESGRLLPAVRALVDAGLLDAGAVLDAVDPAPDTARCR
jgi:hypothetical protein